MNQQKPKDASDKALMTTEFMYQSYW